MIKMFSAALLAATLMLVALGSARAAELVDAPEYAGEGVAVRLPEPAPERCSEVKPERAAPSYMLPGDTSPAAAATAKRIDCDPLATLDRHIRHHKASVDIKVSAQGGAETNIIVGKGPHTVTRRMPVRGKTVYVSQKLTKAEFLQYLQSAKLPEFSKEEKAMLNEAVETGIIKEGDLPKMRETARKGDAAIYSHRAYAAAVSDASRMLTSHEQDTEVHGIGQLRSDFSGLVGSVADRANWALVVAILGLVVAIISLLTRRREDPR